MEQEILQIVKEKLPAIQAQAIADFVAEAKKIKVERDHLEAYRITQEKVHNKTNADIKSLREKLESYENIEKREKEVKALELQNAVNAQKLAGEIEKRQLAVEMFRVVFANAQIKREIFGNTPVPVNDGFHPATMPHESIETTTQE